MAKLLDFMVRCSSATEDDATEDLLRMADPATFDSQDEMSDHFESCLGYDPFVYFDTKSIDEEIDNLINSAPYSVQEQLRGKKDIIIERTLEYSNDLNDTVLSHILAKVIKDTVGWSCDINASLDDCVSMAVFGDEVDDISDEESEDSNDFEDDDSIPDDDDIDSEDDN